MHIILKSKHLQLPPPDLEGLKSTFVLLHSEVFNVVTKRKMLIFNAYLILIQEQLLLDSFLAHTIDRC